MVVETRMCLNVLRADFAIEFILVGGDINTPKYLFEHLDV